MPAHADHSYYPQSQWANDQDIGDKDDQPFQHHHGGSEHYSNMINEGQKDVEMRPYGQQAGNDWIKNENDKGM